MDLRCKSISFSSLIYLLVWKDTIYEAWVLGNCGLSVYLLPKWAMIKVYSLMKKNLVAMGPLKRVWLTWFFFWLGLWWKLQCPFSYHPVHLSVQYSEHFLPMYLQIKSFHWPSIADLHKKCIDSISTILKQASCLTTHPVIIFTPPHLVNSINSND